MKLFEFYFINESKISNLDIDLKQFIFNFLMFKRAHFACFYMLSTLIFFFEIPVDLLISGLLI